MLLKRDEKSGAVLNGDFESLNKYKLLRDQGRKINILQNELQNLKYELSEVRNILSRMER
jgi:hypothetical protein